MEYSKSRLTYFAETNYRSKRILFGIKQQDRLLHTYIIGKTGTGKTNLLRTQIIQDIEAGSGFCIFDIHGDLIKDVFKNIPQSRASDLIYLNLTDPNQPFRFNPFLKVPYVKRPSVASGLIDVFEKLWKSAWGLKLEHILRYIFLTLLDQENSTIADIIRIIESEDYRNECLKNVVSGDVKKFWEKEFKQYSKSDFLPIYNKVGAFLVYPAIKKLLIDNTEEISLRDIMDNRKILLINLSKGILGENVASILGSFILNSLSYSAFSRIDIHEVNRQPFFVYLDEFQNYTTLSIVNMLSELRKFKLALIMAHQYMAQLSDEIRDAVLGNVGTIISFRVGVSDASYLAKEFYPVFEIGNIINLPNYEIYLKLMIDGKPSEPFNAETIKWS